MTWQGTARSEQFRERRASLSTRISVRGHGFEFACDEWVDRTLEARIRYAIQGMQRAHATPGEPARCQLHRLRGALGNFRQMLSRPRAFTLPDVFMTIARQSLPQDVFDAILADARWVREQDGRELAGEIDAALGTTKDGLVTFREKGTKMSRAQRPGVE